MRLVRSLGVTISSAQVIPAALVPLVASPWAKATYGGSSFLCAEVDQQPAPGTLVFIGESCREKDGPVGLCLVDNIDSLNRRASVHGAVLPTRAGLVSARIGFVLTLAVLGETLGFERFWMAPRYGSRGHKLDLEVGFSEEGRLVGHEWGPGGRIDAAVVGATWAQVKAKNQDVMDELEWLTGG